MNRDQAMLIYRRAIDPKADAGEGSSWWAEVHAEIEAVVAAPSVKAASEVIAWWHLVWQDVGDSPVRAAGRIRSRAVSVLKTRESK
jgi:hypothetical protein